VSAEPGPWDPQRLIHRQTYIDLIRAYLLDYGSQRDLARALHMSEAYASYLLDPLRPAVSRRRAAHWSVLLSASGLELAETLRFVKTPSQRRAQQIADQLCTDAERREALLDHINMARRSAEPSSAGSSPISFSEAGVAIEAIGQLHKAALHDSRALVTAAAYAKVWHQARVLAAVIDPRRNPGERAQVLMFLHDTAQVLGRPDLALGLARQALGVTSAADSDYQEAPGGIQMRINAMLAEVVSLNTLGLRLEAAAAIAHAESLTGYNHEPAVWLRSFLEQKLDAMTGSARTSIYHAESTADAALNLVQGDATLQAGIKRRLMDIYLRRPTGRSMRKAHQLESDLRQAVTEGSRVSPLRRAQILRTLARYSRSIRDGGAATALVGECLCVTAEANLVHQRRELIHDLAASNRRDRHPPAHQRVP